MGFAFFEPAMIASLLASPMLPGPVGQAQTSPARSLSACSAASSSTAPIDCCLHIAAWDRPPTTPSNHPAQSQDGAADPEEGR
jgi:hypothetical protein